MAISLRLNWSMQVKSGQLKRMAKAQRGRLRAHCFGLTISQNLSVIASLPRKCRVRALRRTSIRSFRDKGLSVEKAFSTLQPYELRCIAKIPSEVDRASQQLDWRSLVASRRRK